MAVYTNVTTEELKSFLKNYDLGALVSFEGIEAGVSNTNYHLYTDKNHYVLTLFEPHRVKPEEIPFFLSYTRHLKAEGIPCPEMITTKEGDMIRMLAGRPAVISSFLEGDNGMHFYQDAEMCRKAGIIVGRMHDCLEMFSEEQKNRFCYPRWKEWYDSNETQMDKIQEGLQKSVKDELIFLKEHWPSELPRGAIHGDLFPDNFFFRNGDVSGVIDFHFVCTDFLAYDLAIMVNAWCFEHDGIFDDERFTALMEGYEQIRPLTLKEKEFFPILLRRAAMRFLMSRIDEYFKYDPSTTTMKPHDPIPFLKRLETFQDKKIMESVLN